MFKAAVLAGEGRFARSARFWPAAAEDPVPPPEPEAAELPDPLELALAEAHARGRAEAMAEAEVRAAADEAARDALTLSFARLDAAETERLAAALRETVEALCHALIAEAALDPAALARRAEIAARMLARAEDERTFRLHPADLALLAGQLPADWTVVPDPGLERGALRIETAAGGVEDGPGQWRQAVAEALRAC
jgi:flagellar assembly protein FliH